jgi:hypothetical protein
VGHPDGLSISFLAAFVLDLLREAIAIGRLAVDSAMLWTENASMSTTPTNKEPIQVVIRFKHDYSATLIYGEHGTTGFVQERDKLFQKGREYPVAVLDDEGEYVNLTFPDGSELYGLDKGVFEVTGKCPS